MSIAAVILAAGRSSRFEGGHKLLVEIDGVPVIRHVCSALADSSVNDIVLVVANKNGSIAMAAGKGRWRVVENPDAREGLSTSLRLGLENIPGNSAGLLVALGDMPGITTAILNTLISKFTLNPTAIVFPVSGDGRQGHPIIWPKSLFPSLKAITGDTGGKSIRADHKDLWLPVACEIVGAFADIDTRADLEAFCRSRRNDATL